MRIRARRLRPGGGAGAIDDAGPVSFYAEDLAYVHHVGFGGFAEGAAAGVLRLLADAGIRAGLVLDLGCGSGPWARRLLDAGYAVHGIDLSPAMVDLARQTAPGATFAVGSLHDAPLPPAAAITVLGEGIGYLPPGAGDDGRLDLAPLFSRVAQALPRGGLFVFDAVVRAGRGEDLLRYRSWQAGADWAVLVDVAEDAERRTLRRDITLFRSVGGASDGYRRSEETHRVDVLDPRDVSGALREAGFTVRTSRAYGDHALAPRRLAFIARRR